MSDTRQLVLAISKFLKSQVSEDKLAKEDVECVEIGIQCLEAAYKINTFEPDLDVPFGLLEIFQKYLAESKVENEATPEAIAAAEDLKTLGNNLMTLYDFKQAIACYTKAINLHPKNPKYYCNRAAAFNNLKNYESAIQDCKTALKYNSSYIKAYIRLGKAYNSMNNHNEAVNCFKRALELEPENERLKTSLKLAEEALATSQSNWPFALNFRNSDAGFTLDLSMQNSANHSAENVNQNVFSVNLNQGVEELANDILQHLLEGSGHNQSNSSD